MLSFITSLLLLAAGACSTATSSTQADGSGNIPSQTEPLTTTKPDPNLPRAYFAGGCFWCTEASFERIEGVQAVVSGYAGGPEKNPTYKQVASGQTGHTETIAISYDPQKVSYRTLLDVFFVAHDPTTLDRQGPDVGRQYRSAIFFASPEEEALSRTVIDSLNNAKVFSKPIVTEVVAHDKFYDAEAYHQGYYELNPSNPYIANVSRPKVEKVEKRFKTILKKAYKGS